MPDPAFPMHVMPVSAILELKRLPTFEDVRNKQLVEWKPGMTTLFVSQTWLSYAHPDNANNAKLRMLQTFLRGAGKRNIGASWVSELVHGSKLLQLSAKQLGTIEYVWFDLR